MRPSALFYLLLVLLGGAAGCASASPLPGRGASSAAVLYGRAQKYYEAGNYTRAQELFHQYIGEHPETPLFKVSLYSLAVCYQMEGDLKEALVLYSRLVDSYGDDDFWGQQALQRIRQIRGES